MSNFFTALYPSDLNEDRLTTYWEREWHWRSTATKWTASISTPSSWASVVQDFRITWYPRADPSNRTCRPKFPHFTRLFSRGISHWSWMTKTSWISWILSTPITETFLNLQSKMEAKTLFWTTNTKTSSRVAQKSLFIPLSFFWWEYLRDNIGEIILKLVLFDTSYFSWTHTLRGS